MTKLIEVMLDDETSIYIEAEEDKFSSGPETPAAFGDDIETKGKEYFDKAIATIKKFGGVLKEGVKDLGPDETEFSFNLKLSTESKVILSTFGAEGNIGVKLKWKKSDN